MIELTLNYRGPLKSNGRPSEKHHLRCHFHNQLATFWKQPYVADLAKNLWLAPRARSTPFLQEIGQFKFAPLVCSRFKAAAKLDVTLLRPEPPGSILTQGGDIDNRIKTLLDSLKMPRRSEELPPEVVPDKNQDPFFVLLEGDNLVSSLSIRTSRLLDAPENSKDVLLLVQVSTERFGTTYENVDF
jgi:hypothetical protein